MRMWVNGRIGSLLYWVVGSIVGLEDGFNASKDIIVPQP